VAIKSFKIKWGPNNEDQTVEYEDDIPFGDIERVIRNNVDMSKINDPKVNLGEYRMGIALKVLKTAPFDITVNGISKVGFRTMKEVMKHIMEDYALANFLEDWMTSLMGSQNMKELASEYMDTVPTDSGGQKMKQIDVPQSGLKNSSPSQTK